MNPEIPNQLRNKFVGLDIYLARHCNLRCRGCTRFANIAKPQFYDYDQYVLDIHKIKDLGIIPEHVTISGGEPLLHPRAIDFLELARELFPTIEIGISSNGILFTKQSDEWYKKISDLNVSFTYTKYPTTAVDYDKIHELGKKYNIPIVNINELSFFTKDTNPLGTRDELDTHYLRKPKENDAIPLPEVKKLCICGGDCPAIFNGKLFQCGIACNVNALNEKYHTDFKVTEDCYLEVSKITSKEELYKFLLKPTSFCRYCYNNANHKFKWERGVVDKDDWLKYYE